MGRKTGQRSEASEVARNPSDACLADTADTRAATAPRRLRGFHSADHPTRPVIDGVLVDPDRDGLSEAGVSEPRILAYFPV